EMINNFDPILPDRYQIWMEEINKQDLAGDEQVLGLMNIGGIIKKDYQGNMSMVNIPQSEDNYLRLVGCELIAQNDIEALNLIFDEKINLWHTIVLETYQPKSFGLCDQNQGEIDIQEKTPGYLKLEVDLKQDNWIFWSQTWYPGWKGKIDGSAVEVHRANYLFQAIHSEKGNHIVEFIYRPSSFYWGSSISLIGLIILAWGFLGKKKQS
ncbi:MAG: YfhO family protein, partial [Anaerolineales bacterium]|nr:YfhO family protein [Anaerolineales bacterium]